MLSSKVVVATLFISQKLGNLILCQSGSRGVAGDLISNIEEGLYGIHSKPLVLGDRQDDSDVSISVPNDDWLTLHLVENLV